MSTHQSWEVVLAAVEADVAHTEELLAAERLTASEDPAERYVAPALWQLPVSKPELPPLEQMPAVPESLRERIRELRLRIVALQIELASELAQVRAAQDSPLARAIARRPLVSAAPAQYFDSRI